MEFFKQLQHINKIEKLNNLKQDAYQKHIENMKRHNYRKQIKNKIKAKKSKLAQIKNQTKNL